MDLDHMRPTWAEVNLHAIQSNVRAIKRLITAPHFMAVVKANGYGHGAAQVAAAALEAGADWLGVATVEEGITLRRQAITAPILVLGYVAPGQAEEVLQYDLRVALFDMQLAQALNQVGQTVGAKARVHLKIDTGMGRVGVRLGELVAMGRQLLDLPHIMVEGAFTHFAAADEPQNSYTAQQVALFEGALAQLAEIGLRPPIRHASNSAGLLIHPEAHYDMVRAGIIIYGLPPDPAVDWPVSLTPALSWKTRVAMVKRVEAGSALSYGCTYTTAGTEQIATLPVGYADGYSRLLSNKAEVLIRGHRCPVVGRVCMDQMMVRVPDEIDVHVGDEVVLIGRQGEQEITATEVGRWMDTTNYEVICSLSPRVPRFYHPEE